MSPSDFEILAHETAALGLLGLHQRVLSSRPGAVIIEIMLDAE